MEVDLLYLRRLFATFQHYNNTQSHVQYKFRRAGDEADQSEVDGNGRLAAVSTHALPYCSSTQDPP